VRLAVAAALVLAAGLWLGGCSRGTEAERAEKDSSRGGLTPVRLQLDWYPQPEHGGFFQALARGYYEQAGLDVELLSGGPRSMVLQKVALGQVTFGLWRSDDVTVAVSRGLPLVCVGAVFQKDPQALMYHAEHPVRGFADLEGRTVMAGAASVWVRLVEKKYGIQVHLTPVTFSIAQFMQDPLLVQQCLVTSEPFQARQAGAEVGTLLVAETGHNPYHAIIANRDWVAANRAVAEAFVRASLRGWRDYLEGDPSAAFAEIARRNPQHNDASMRFSREMIIRERLATGEPGEGGLGHVDRERLSAQAKILEQFGLLERPVSGAELVAEGFPLAAEE